MFQAPNEEEHLPSCLLAWLYAQPDNFLYESRTKVYVQLVDGEVIIHFLGVDQLISDMSTRGSLSGDVDS